MSTYRDGEQLGQLIGVLRPAPDGWVHAAKELPAARAAIDSLVERALAGASERERIVRDLEGALRAAGLEPRPEIVAELRSRLTGEAGGPG